MSTVVTFGEIMLRLSPPGFERFLQTPALRRHVRRRRGQRRRQRRAVRPREPLRHAPAGARHRRRGGAGAARRRRPHRLHRPRRRSRRHLLRRGGRQPARLDGHLRPRALGDRRDDARHGRLGGGVRRRDLVPHHRHHAGARRQRPSPAPRKRSRPPGRPACRVSVDLNFRKKLWNEKQAQAAMRPLMPLVDVVIANEEDMQSVLGIQVEGTDVTAGAAESRRPTSRGRAQITERVRLHRRWRSRCARASRRATTAGARCCSTRRPAPSTAASTTTCA